MTRHLNWIFSNRGSAGMIFATIISLLACANPIWADTTERRIADFASGSGNIIYLALGVLSPLVRDGPAGKDQTLRTADALLANALLTEALKSATHKRRPDGSGYDSFPSGHTSAAFTVATVESHFNQKQAPYWYAGAALIAWSRVRLDRHSTKDVVAGAVLGNAVANWELRHSQGLILRPSIHPNGEIGLQLTKLY